MRQHARGKGARYLRVHKPEELVHVEEFDSRADAMKRERKVKSLNHDQKLRLSRSKTRTAHRAKPIATRQGRTRRT